MRQIEHPRHVVVERHGNIELRDYPPMIVAETDVAGERRQAIQAGFRIIADYIFGNNRSSEKVAMTAPVLQGGVGNLWRVRFIMPADKRLVDLPRPNDARVSLVALGAARFAVIRFSGAAGENSLTRNAGQILAFVRSRHWKAVGSPVYAFYDPPWTLPYLRRNEVMVALE